mmetsp:Transcript_7883/g.13214  ORF Transcript_7883/g.13214 Transcript_7883/m.13214 type:complete len:184 (+) Transcript_7883:1188-1739(+)
MVLNGQYQQYEEAKRRLEQERDVVLNPLNRLGDKVANVNERIQDAKEIFGRKFQLVQDQVQSMLEKIEEDKLYQDEMLELRRQEISMLSLDVDRFFEQELKMRKEQELKLQAFVEDRSGALKLLVSEQSRQRYEQVELIEGSLASEVPSVQDQIRELKLSREYKENFVLEQVKEKMRESFQGV